MNRPAMLRLILVAAMSVALPRLALAQRALHWTNLDVAAHLAANGDLRIVETQTMVLTGDWNGGERKFTIHPRQTLTFEALSRGGPGGWAPLTEDSKLNDVGDYAWIDPGMLRWRSRMRSDPPFAGTTIPYQLRYVLSPVLLKENDGYRLDHDFAFRDREGVIERFTLRFTYDAVWQPAGDVRNVYTAGPLAPGRTFVLNLPLRYSGSQIPKALDLSRPAEIQIAVAAILGFTALAIGWFFYREHSNGRFAPLTAETVNEAWLEQHILKHPAEVVGAAWDQGIGKDEVVALIARMVGEGKLASSVDDGGGPKSSMTLTLKVDRTTLDGYERTLVDRLFFDGRTDTTTELVKDHYRDEGFDPASEIKDELETAVQRLLPDEPNPRGFRIESLLLFLVGAATLVVAWMLGTFQTTGFVLPGVSALVLAIAGGMTGLTFRANLQWRQRAALASLIPAVLLALVMAAFLWFRVGAGMVELSTEALIGIVAMTLALINGSINGLRSRQGRAAIALRKTLVAGREYFKSELRKEQPALRDRWYPWALAFGLGKEVDDWSAQRAVKEPEEPGSGRRRWASEDSGAESSGPAPEEWGGFGGGRSGGAGAGGSWAAAAGGMAAGISPPRASSSGDSSGGGSSWSSSDSGSSSSGSSSSGSSGGGGGGGW